MEITLLTELPDGLDAEARADRCKDAPLYKVRGSLQELKARFHVGLCGRNKAGEYDTDKKDEAYTILFIGIILASFIPAAQPYMKSGFEFLKTAPDFIQWGILASIGASFGIKSIGQFRK